MAAEVTMRGARPQPTSFEIFPDDEHLLNQRYPPVTAQSGVDLLQGALEELPIDYQALSPKHCEPFKSSQGRQSAESATFPSKIPTRSPRRRLPVNKQTFEPLEETLEDKQQASPSVQVALQQQDLQHHPLADIEVENSIDHQIGKQLAGQFDWVMTYPAPASIGCHLPRASRDDDQERPKGERTFGCNLLARKYHSTSKDGQAGSEKADTYTFIAIPIEDRNATENLPSKDSQDLEEQVNMAVSQHMAHMDVPLAAGDVPCYAEHAVSPSLTHVSERSGSFVGHDTKRDSLSVPRIEDSLEELDKLEEQIEAINAVTSSGRPVRTRNGEDQATSTFNSSPLPKKVTIASGQSATVRIKSSAKMRPALRRSNSLMLREKQSEPEQVASEQKAANMPISRTKSTSIRSSDSRAPVKSTKPLTIPKFQLPGEAVSLRLKEQREARKAQQAEAQKATAAPTKPRSTRLPTRPNFELPGEAISRKKREEKAAKLKAEEEEARKRREFKARPIRQSLGSTTLPRDTVASRARISMFSSEDSAESQGLNPTRRLSTAASPTQVSTVATRGSSTLRRGRNSMIMPSDDASRATSTSTGVSEKRSSVSLEDVAHQRARGREIFARDNSYSRDRESEKRERETQARLAREQAAERSRAASREWAQKQRQRQSFHMDDIRSQERVFS